MLYVCFAYNGLVFIYYVIYTFVMKIIVTTSVANVYFG